MIFKMQSNIFRNNLEEILNKTKNNFDVLFYGTNLFISIKKYTQRDSCDSLIKKIFKPSKNFLITKIDENNLKYEAKEVKEWCKNKFIELEIQELEDKEQEKLQGFYKFLIDFDKNLQDL